MPRRARAIIGGLVYHVMNRANARARLFQDPADYDAFERVLEQAHARVPMRLLSYCVMPNHWHLVLWPHEGEDDSVSEFMRWLTVTHAQRWHAHRGTSGTGHLYQGRFKAFPAERDEHLLSMCRYVESNATRAGLVQRAEQWRWCSLARRLRGTAEACAILSRWPIEIPRNWLWLVNHRQGDPELEAIRQCIQRGRPFGHAAWVQRIARTLRLESTLRPRGRPTSRAT